MNGSATPCKGGLYGGLPFQATIQSFNDEMFTFTEHELEERSAKK